MCFAFSKGIKENPNINDIQFKYNQVLSKTHYIL